MDIKRAWRSVDLLMWGLLALWIVAVSFLVPVNGQGAVPSLRADVEAARKAYGPTMSAAECVELLNAVAWKNRAGGWGLGQKTSGNYGIRKDGAKTTTDGLVHRNAQSGYLTFVDALGDAGENGSNPPRNGRATPQWLVASNPSNRPFVAPIDPGSAPPPQPPPADVAARVEALEKQMVAANAAIVGLRQDVADHGQQIIALRVALQTLGDRVLVLENKPPGAPPCTVQDVTTGRAFAHVHTVRTCQ